VSKPYKLQILVNGKNITELIIGDHYKENHPDINDEIIIDLVSLLDGKRFVGEKTDQYEYFRSELERNQKLYGLIWILEENKVYVGVINTYRINKRSE
jgi:hypothetical protein